MKLRDALDRRAQLAQELLEWNQKGAEASEKLSRLWGELSPRQAKKREELCAQVELALKKIEEISRQRSSVLLDTED